MARASFSVVAGTRVNVPRRNVVHHLRGGIERLK
jgi:hypothetical protein